jgi:hypothetical protein
MIKANDPVFLSTTAKTDFFTYLPGIAGILATEVDTPGG